MATAPFTIDEFAWFMRKDPAEIDVDTAALFMELAAAEIAGVAGGSIPTDPRVKGLALKVCARAYRASSDKISETIDDYTYRLKGENFAEELGVTIDLPDRRRLRQWAGLASSGSVALRDRKSQG